MTAIWLKSVATNATDRNEWIDRYIKNIRNLRIYMYTMQSCRPGLGGVELLEARI